MGLTPTQEKLRVRIVEFLKRPPSMLSVDQRIFLLKGYAGTGKTFAICNIISTITDSSSSSLVRTDIRLCAPTNKAKKILREGTRGIFETKTIHQLMDIKQTVDEYGRKRFDGGYIKENPDPAKQFKVVVIDECSMVPKHVYDLILKLLKYIPYVKVIFMGDPCQLPPVNELASMTFDRPTNFELTDIIRNKGALQHLCNYVRADQSVAVQLNTWVKLVKKDPNAVNPITGKGLDSVVLISDETLWKDTIFRAFETIPDTHVLTWTNKRTDTLNTEIRHKLFAEKAKDRFCVGERIIATSLFKAIPDPLPPPFNCSGVIDLTTPMKIPFDILVPHFTCDQFVITEIVDETCNVNIVDHSVATDTGQSTLEMLMSKDTSVSEGTNKSEGVRELFSLPTKKLYIRESDLTNSSMSTREIVDADTSTGTDREYIHIYNPETAKDTYDLILAKVTAIAKKCTDMYKQTKTAKARENAKSAWLQVYMFKDTFAPEITYDYSTTVHKSQGSTYKLVFVDLKDISKNRDMLYRNQCLYTAFSRPSGRLIIYN